MKLLIVANNIKWKSLDTQVKTLKKWFLPYFDIDIQVTHISFKSIPFVKDREKMYRVDTKWYDKNIIPLATGYDFVLLLIEKEDWKGKGAGGWRTNSKNNIIKLQIGTNEKDHKYINSKDVGSLFFIYARHEILHALFMKLGIKDTVHKWVKENKIELALKDLTQIKKTNMKIYRPIKTNYITQGFGEEKAMVKVDINGNPYRPFVVKSIPSSGIPLGWAGFYTTILRMKGHNGEDWMSWNGEPCYFPVFIDNIKWHAKNEIDSDGGIGIDIISDNKVIIGNNTGYVKFRFWHLKESNVIDGQEVKFGDMIALCDSTGASSGHHLHWSMKWCDKDGVSLNKDNGFYGAVNFTEWFENIFVLDYIKKETEIKDINIKIKKAEFSLKILMKQLIIKLQIQVLKLKKEIARIGSVINK